MTRTFEIEVTQRFKVVVNDEDVITRVIENHDDQGRPQPRGGNGWQDNLYDLQTDQAVIEHLVWNLGLRGVPLTSLDGWADLTDAAAVEVSVLDTDFEFFKELP